MGYHENRSFLTLAFEFILKSGRFSKIKIIGMERINSNFENLNY
jgi:hypothetical protein